MLLFLYLCLPKLASTSQIDSGLSSHYLEAMYMEVTAIKSKILERISWDDKDSINKSIIWMANDEVEALFSI